MFSESDVLCINSQMTGLCNMCPDTVWVQCNTHLLHLCNVEGTSGQIRVRWNPTVAQVKRRNIRASNPVLVELQWLCYDVKNNLELTQSFREKAGFLSENKLQWLWSYWCDALFDRWQFFFFTKISFLLSNISIFFKLQSQTFFCSNHYTQK